MLAANGLRTGAVAVLKHQTFEYAQCKFNEIMFIYPTSPLFRQCAVIGRAVLFCPLNLVSVLSTVG